MSILFFRARAELSRLEATERKRKRETRQNEEAIKSNRNLVGEEVVLVSEQDQNGKFEDYGES